MTKHCWICLESNGEIIRGCACCGSAGCALLFSFVGPVRQPAHRFVHVTCMIEANKHRKSDHTHCPTCNQQFVGALQFALAKARVHTTRVGKDFNAPAVSALAWALVEKGCPSEGLALFEKVLDPVRSVFDRCTVPCPPKKPTKKCLRF